MIKSKIKKDRKMLIFTIKANNHESVIYSDKINEHSIWDVGSEMCDSHYNTCILKMHPKLKGHFVISNLYSKDKTIYKVSMMLTTLQ